MSDEDLQCTCSGRPLGADHRSSCPMWEFTDMEGKPRDGEAAEVIRHVTVVRNPETERPVAVPEEVVEEAEREYRAYKQFRSGHTWNDIAVKEGYPSGSAASEAVRRYLDEGRTIIADMRREEVLATEVDFLRWVRTQIIAGVELGKPSSIAAAHANHDRMMKALGMDQPSPDDSVGETVVVPSDDYIATLQVIDGELADDEDQAAG